MKTKIAFAIMFFAFIGNISAYRIVNVTKSGGILRHYDYVDQDFIGKDAAGNTYWDLTCLNPGWERCKLQTANVVVTEDPGNEEIASAEINSSNSAIEWADNEIETKGVASGSLVKHYLVKLTDNSTLDVYVELTWSPIAGTGEYSIKAVTYHA